MTPAVRFLGCLAMVPAMIGPLPLAARELAVALCGGGTIAIPLGAPKLPGSDQTPCCAKGCHAGSCSRKRLDRTQ